MKKLSIFLGLIVACYIVFAQSTDTRSLPSFERVSSSEGIEVVLTSGKTTSAKIIASGIDVEDVLTEVNGDVLRISLDGNSHRNTDVRVEVTYNTLRGLRASSASSITVKDAVKASGNFDIDASSAGSVSVTVTAESVDMDVSSSGDIDAVVTVDELEAEISSSGDINISGTAREADVRASSAGEFDGYDFTCKEADLRASSGASIKITVTDKVDGGASSGGSIRFKGNPPNVDADSSSGGSVKRS